MKIGAIEQSYGNFYNVHNVTGVSQVKQTDVHHEEQIASKEADSQKDNLKQSEDSAERKPVTHMELEDISLNFNKGETYDYIGKDSDINNLDVKKAVSDMRKDQLLEQYQYFVGATQDDILLNNQDGLVIRK
jgi:hypothetical protein